MTRWHCTTKKKESKQALAEKRIEGAGAGRGVLYSAGRARGCISSVLVCGVLFSFFSFFFEDGRYVLYVGADVGNAVLR